MSCASATRGSELARTGYSLVELLGALALSGLLAALALPNLRELVQPWALDGGSRQVAAAFQSARQRAIARNVRHRLVFLPPRALRLEREAKPGVFVVDGSAQALPSPVSLGKIKPKMPTFDTRGILLEPASVSMRTSPSHKRTVSVNVLGRTTIQ
jgi:type II secretory pathway pseudopilin PulG